MSEKPTVDELRARLRELGYLDAGVDRFVLGPVRGSRGLLSVAWRSSARIGLLAALLLGPSTVTALAVRIPGLVTGVRDALVLALYLGVFFGVAVTAGSLLAALVLGVFAARLGDRTGAAARARVLSMAAGALVAAGCLVYLVFWWRTVSPAGVAPYPVALDLGGPRAGGRHQPAARAPGAPHDPGGDRARRGCRLHRPRTVAAVAPRLRGARRHRLRRGGSVAVPRRAERLGRVRARRARGLPRRSHRRPPDGHCHRRTGCRVPRSPGEGVEDPHTGAAAGGQHRGPAVLRRPRSGTHVDVVRDGATGGHSRRRRHRDAAGERHRGDGRSAIRRRGGDRGRDRRLAPHAAGPHDERAAPLQDVLGGGGGRWPHDARRQLVGHLAGA